MSVKLDEDAQLLEKALNTNGGAKILISGYNHFLFERLPMIIQGKRIKINDSYEGLFSNLRLERPVDASNNESKELYPATARREDKSYFGSIVATFKIRNTDTNQFLSLDEKTKDGNVVSRNQVDVLIGKIPVMLQSELCHLNGLTPSELYDKGEGRLDPGGYFIINGVEKILLNQERLLPNKPLMYHKINKKIGSLKTSSVSSVEAMTVTYTSQTLYESTIFNLFEHERILVTLFPKGNDMNLMVNILAVLSLMFYKLHDGPVDYVETFFELFNSFVNGDDVDIRKRKARIHMASTIQHFNTVNSDLLNVAKYIDAHTNGEFLLSENPDESEIKSYIDTVALWLLDTVMKNIPYDAYAPVADRKASISKKIRTIVYMVVKLVEYNTDFRKIDNRDGWENKMIVTPALHIETFFTKIWNKIVNSLTVIFRKTFPADFASAKRTYDGVRDKNSFEKTFSTSFTSGLWGLAKGAAAKDVVIVATLKRDTYLAVVSHLLKIVITSNKRAKIREKRLVQPTQFNRICPATTPEGKTCGLVKSAAVTNFPSLSRDINIVLNLIMNTNVEYISNDQTEQNQSPIFIDGVCYGYCNEEQMRTLVIEARRELRIPFDISVVVTKYHEVFIYTGAGRACAPLLIVDPKTTEIVIDKNNGVDRKKSFLQLLSTGRIEYLDVWEEIESAYIADVRQKVRIQKDQIDTAVQNLEELNRSEEENPIKRTAYMNVINAPRYTHSLIDPASIFSTPVSIMPVPEKAQGPRVTYQASMGTQALGPDTARFNTRFDTTIRLAVRTGVPLFATNLHRHLGLDEAPAGQTAFVAIMTYGGENQEDAIVMNQRSVDLGLFRSLYYTSSKVTFANKKDFNEYSAIPEHEEDDIRYRNLVYNEEFDIYVVAVGARVELRDCLVAKLSVSTSASKKNKRPEDKSVYVGTGKGGIVDEVVVAYDSQMHKLVKIRVRQERIPMPGDKFASRYAQKGVIGRIVPEIDLPFIVSDNPRIDGMVPDIIFNPHGMPSRMTIGKLEEPLASMFAVATGQRVNASAFRRFQIGDIQNMLEAKGFSRTGKYKMRNGKTGEMITSEIYSGPIYYQALRHQVQDKMQARGKTGTINKLTRTGTAGIRSGGTLRIGEMERDAIMGHGATQFGIDRLKFTSDPFTVIICSKCNSLQGPNIRENESDACGMCGAEDAEFTKTVIPYSLKLFTQLMAHASVKIRFNTTKA